MHSNPINDISGTAACAASQPGTGTLPLPTQQRPTRLTEAERSRVCQALDEMARSMSVLVETAFRTLADLKEQRAALTRYAVDTPPSASARFTGRTDVQ